MDTWNICGKSIIKNTMNNSMPEKWHLVLEWHKEPKLTQGKMSNLNRPTSIIIIKH